MARQRKINEEETENNRTPMFLGVPAEELDEDEINEMAEEDEFDIFTDVGQKLTAAGDRITYTIRKDGEFIAGSIKHPFSWDKIQSKYGGGTYTISARSTNKGKYIKTQTRNVAEVESEEEDSHEREEKRGSSTTDLLMLLQAQKREEREELMRLEEKRENERREREEKAEQERRDREAQMKAASDSTMLMMMKMMESQSNQTTALLTAMLQGNQKKEPEFSAEKLINMMESRMEKVIALVQGKDKTKDIDALKLIELQSQAEDRGYKRAMDLQSQAERKAEELAELRENASGSGQETVSTTKMLIDAVVPAVQTIMAARGGIPSMAPNPQIPVVDPHRPALPPPVMRSPGPVRAPTVVQPGPKAPILTPNVRVQKELNPMSQRDLIENTVFTEIGKDLSANLLSQKFSPEKTADRVLEILKPFGISPQSLCSQYTLDAMIEIARKKGVPDAIKPYLERFHAHIKAKTPVAVGEPSKGGEQPAK